MPKAFISHSTCDLAFCLQLYEDLRGFGITPIMFERDVQPGDDWVDEIFESGIGSSDGVIFVLSPGSVNRPGVREELSVSVVERLRRQTRLIPIIIGLADDQVPRVLSPKKWIPFAPGSDIRKVAEEISAVLHADAKPNPIVELEAPRWTRQPLSGRLGLDPRDEAVFAEICRMQLTSPSKRISRAEVEAFMALQGLPEGTLRTTYSVLQRRYYLEPPRSARGGLLPVSFELTRLGFESYMRAYEPGRFQGAGHETIAAIANGRASNFEELMACVSEPSAALLDLIITILEARGELSCVIRPLNSGPKWKAADSITRLLESEKPL